MCMVMKVLTLFSESAVKLLSPCIHVSTIKGDPMCSLRLCMQRWSVESCCFVSDHCLRHSPSKKLARIINSLWPMNAMNCSVSSPANILLPQLCLVQTTAVNVFDSGQRHAHFEHSQDLLSRQWPRQLSQLVTHYQTVNELALCAKCVTAYVVMTQEAFSDSNEWHETDSNNLFSVW